MTFTPVDKGTNWGRAIVSNCRTALQFPLFTVQKLVNVYCIGLLLRTNRTCTVNLGPTRLTLPNTSIPFITAEQVFVDQPYKHIAQMRCVIDLGGYLGESAVYLARQNKKVMVYEPDANNFIYLAKNIKQTKNIVGINKAVTASSAKTLTFQKSSNNDYGGNAHKLFGKNQQSQVSAISFARVINSSVDGMKMDVEGAEFELLQWIITHQDQFAIREGYVEFHFFGKNIKHLTIFNRFVQFLEEKNYVWRIYEHDLNSLAAVTRCHNRLNKHESLIFQFAFSYKGI